MSRLLRGRGLGSGGDDHDQAGVTTTIQVTDHRHNLDEGARGQERKARLVQHGLTGVVVQVRFTVVVRGASVVTDPRDEVLDRAQRAVCLDIIGASGVQRRRSAETGFAGRQISCRVSRTGRQSRFRAPARDWQGWLGGGCASGCLSIIGVSGFNAVAEVFRDGRHGGTCRAHAGIVAPGEVIGVVVALSYLGLARSRATAAASGGRSCWTVAVTIAWLVSKYRCAR